MCQLQGLALNSHNQVSSVAHCLASLSPVLIVSSDMYLFTEHLNQGLSAHPSSCTLQQSIWQSVTSCQLQLPQIEKLQLKQACSALKLSYRSHFNMRLEFLFSVLQLWPSSTPFFTEKGKDNSPASGTGKTDLLCSLFSFQFSMEVNNWKPSQPSVAQKKATQPACNYIFLLYKQ